MPPARMASVLQIIAQGWRDAALSRDQTDAPLGRD
jgi:hypothetical protein